MVECTNRAVIIIVLVNLMVIGAVTSALKSLAHGHLHWIVESRMFQSAGYNSNYWLHPLLYTAAFPLHAILQFEIRPCQLFRMFKMATHASWNIHRTTNIFCLCCSAEHSYICFGRKQVVFWEMSCHVLSKMTGQCHRIILWFTRYFCDLFWQFTGCIAVRPLYMAILLT